MENHQKYAVGRFDCYTNFNWMHIEKNTSFMHIYWKVLQWNLIIQFKPQYTNFFIFYLQPVFNFMMTMSKALCVNYNLWFYMTSFISFLNTHIPTFNSCFSFLFNIHYKVQYVTVQLFVITVNSSILNNTNYHFAFFISLPLY